MARLIRRKHSSPLILTWRPLLGVWSGLWGLDPVYVALLEHHFGSQHPVNSKDGLRDTGNGGKQKV
jgi:hypothetical protein